MIIIYKKLKILWQHGAVLVLEVFGQKYSQT